ncbi:tail fiber assembly protein [Enterobacter bugandensis]|uniref:tail fiber assembly protein n=1 Tax=Enterobacter TaxID=547 RepID=UPI0012522716|nr:MULTISPECIES: tail fiber assembly protein [Enterobacter]EHN8827619.1 tail fiber assembly protein [Enterobacter bugandensis]EHN8845367.1 tail fiber assembly protein [Enterobacter bugandensis]MCK6702136.1 tail fiber assembly protein [Enterobacter bugandensis]MCK6777668.1 tail fiber assembly protein [Enterobacter bugandensis]VAC24332.1 phage tail fiber assembly protein [Enterobacter hormaechei]
MTMQSGIFKQYDPLEKWGKYTATKVAKLSPEELELYYIAKSPGMNIVFLKDDNGNDWYQWLKTLSQETLKVSFNPETKEIIHFSYDASAIFPINQIVVEVAPENVPDEFTAAGEKALGGAFLFVDGEITAAPVDYEAEAQRKKLELLNQANNVIATLQDAIDLDMATDEEAEGLTQWRKYRVLLSRVDATAPVWPEVPGNVA